MNRRIQELVDTLELIEHPEGGFYKENYRSTGEITIENLPDEFNGSRNYCTGIYFLLTSGNFSAFHRINQDEMWHFYEGSPLTVHMIDNDGNYSFQKVGLDIKNMELPQFVVPKNVWFASEVNTPHSYSFVGCTVSPGFDFDDFELADRETLLEQFPTHQEIIIKLTR